MGLSTKCFSLGKGGRGSAKARTGAVAMGMRPSTTGRTMSSTTNLGTIGTTGAEAGALEATLRWYVHSWCG